MARYEQPEKISKLIKFVEWAIRRGGDAFNDANLKGSDELTKEEKEMKKPFWTRTYFIGTKEFRFDRRFINEYMQNANVMVKDNQSAYHDYKKRALFPKISDKSQAFMKNKSSTGQSMGFVEYQEAQIKELYDLFVTLCT